MADAGDLKSSAARRAGSSPAARTSACALAVFACAAAFLASCDEVPVERTTSVSVIGPAPSLRDFSRSSARMADLVYADAVAQGLVRFDANGQVEPGLAARWIVIDSGRTYIFRLRRLRWPDGRLVTAGDVAAALRRQIGPGSRNPLAPYLTAVEAVRAMTPDVVEIDLSRSRPDLLKLFAQPQLAITRPLRAARLGTGPYAPTGADPLLLGPRAEPDRAEDEQVAAKTHRIRLTGERAAAAILRFRDRSVDLVLGGTFSDWPLVTLAEIERRDIQIDPAAGLFGLAVLRHEGFLADVAGRTAVAEAIDRTALLGAFSRNWVATEQLLPGAADSAAAPAVGGWAALSPDDRLADARRIVAEWRASNGSVPTLRIALPRGAGASRLWAHLAGDLVTAGIRPLRVGPTDAADLRLVDAVAPYDSARWYLAAACPACRQEVAAAIDAARVAPTLDERATANAAADAALAAQVDYIPIGRPFRWSLVARRLRGWSSNDRAWHPLNRLVEDPN